MSSFLYALGKFAYRRKGLVFGAWLLILLLAGGSAAALSKGFNTEFTIPGTESQEALDSLQVTLPQMAHSSATIVLVAPVGTSVEAADVKSAVASAISDLDGIDQVATAQDPYSGSVSGLINADSTALMIPVQLDVERASVLPATTEAITAVADRLGAELSGATASAGGDAFGITGVSLSITEVIGVIVALIVLTLTFGSLLAAAIPLTTAILGVVISTALILLSTAFATISSTTPILAIMLGLAVGIDYALFILTRYRAELASGKEPEDAAGIATATAGSAVVFAGLTVIIALVGLFVANIPFLTVMGIAAAVGVAVAVVVALTLLPAFMGLMGQRLVPRTRRARRSAKPTANGAEAGHPIARRWISIVTRIPALTIIVVVGAVALLALPAQGLRLALPTNGEATAGSPARVTYDLITDHFGPGYNAPLLVTGSIIESTDPLTLVDKLKSTLDGVEGVEKITLATPNQNADTAIVQIIPTTGAADPETATLVKRLRDMAPEISNDLGIDIKVTGVTALQIDVSQRLADALIPFGVFVVGLSLILLAIIFRSIWVPLKATVGYLLSVLAAFGVTALVFEDGWFNSVFNVEATGPVISFMPIILMGVLFGLAMDYEVFLVSRMREDFVHGGDAEAAVRSGFLGSAQVVTAAAVIMFFVFAAFIPEGESAIKSIALGLAAGVFVDAFVVRMTLVPAVLVLLGRHAWWMPRWLDRILPFVDVEGAGVTHLRELAEWPADGSVLAVEGLGKTGSRGAIVRGFSLRARAGEIVLLAGGRGSGKTAIALMVSGRMSIDDGRATVDGKVLPEQASWVRRDSMYIASRTSVDAADDIRRIRGKNPTLLVVDDVDTLRDPDARQVLAGVIADADSGAVATTIVLTSEHPELAADVLGAARVRIVDCAPPERVGQLASAEPERI